MKPYQQSSWFYFAVFIFAVFLFGSIMADAAKSDVEEPSESREEEIPFELIARDRTAGRSPLDDRAFWGAPPPHPHKGVKQKDCLHCHAPENKISMRWRAIRPMPHANLSQCLQCHVSQDRSVDELFAVSEYVGLDAPGEGEQNNDYAPPSVPHKVYMRENCLSCHGETGYSFIRTTHPERSLCLQCHVPEADMDYTRPRG